MMKFGQNFIKEAIEWNVDMTASENGHKLMCQETLLLLDVGAWPELEDTPPHWPGPALPWSLFPAALPI